MKLKKKYRYWDIRNHCWKYWILLFQRIATSIYPHNYG